VLLGGVRPHPGRSTSRPIARRLVQILLPSVNLPMIAHVDALGLQAGEVRPRARLGVALAPAQLALHDRRDVPLLLFLGRHIPAASGRTSRCPCPSSDCRRPARSISCCNDAGLRAGKPAAAVLWSARSGRPSPCRPCAVSTPGGRGVWVSAPGIIAIGWLASDFREIGLDPVAGFGAEGVEVGAAKNRRHHRILFPNFSIS